MRAQTLSYRRALSVLALLALPSASCAPADEGGDMGESAAAFVAKPLNIAGGLLKGTVDSLPGKIHHVHAAVHLAWPGAMNDRGCYQFANRF